MLSKVLVAIWGGGINLLEAYSSMLEVDLAMIFSLVTFIPLMS